jgi:endonuclease-3 related protein
MMIPSDQIYRELAQMDLLTHRPPWWWPHAGTFEVLIGAVLTQNTTWHNVEKSLANLRQYLGIQSPIDLGHFLTIDSETLKTLIKPSGFYNQKAPRLHIIAKNIKSEFGSFEAFVQRVDRAWLLEQKGIGKETADSILNYGCFRDVMVVDSYTQRLLSSRYAIHFKSYDAYQNYLEEGMRSAYVDQTALHFARFHGMIVEYNKRLKKHTKSGGSDI